MQMRKLRHRVVEMLEVARLGSKLIANASQALAACQTPPQGLTCSFWLILPSSYDRYYS